MGKKQWQHLIVPESQSQFTCLFKQLGSGALFRKPHLKDEGIKVQEEALKFWNLQYWFQTNMGLLFEAWKAMGFGQQCSHLGWVEGKANDKRW